jgi:hypothetical protein
MSNLVARSTRALAHPMRLVWCVSLVALSMLAVSAVAGQDGAGAATSGGPALHAAAAAVGARPAITVGNTACGSVSLTPSSDVKGGTKLKIKIDWKGSPSNAKCTMPTTNCGSVYFGDCNAGYWVIGTFCSTLAAKNIATGQADCDLNNIVVFTDYNSGPNNPTDNTGTSYNQCTTVSTLGSIFGGLPGTLYCITDGSGGDGWADHWSLGSATGTATGQYEQTGSTTAPFKPSAAGVDCPPSAANIKAGALPNYCAFVVMPVEFSYYCTFGCFPDPSDPNDGSSEMTKDYLATLFSYTPAKKTVRHAGS